MLRSLRLGLVPSTSPEIRSKIKCKIRQVVCAHSDLLLDEAPAAYKNIRVVMRGQSDLVKSVFELTPLLSVKGR